MDIIRSLYGMVQTELVSADPAASLDAIADAGIPLHHVVQTDDVTLRFFVLRIHFRLLKQMAEHRGERLTLLERTGVYWGLKSVLNRPVLLAGMVFLLLMVIYLPTRVLFVRVEGNSTIPSRLILEAAESSGICFGASRREVRSERVKNALLQAVPQLQWAGVNTYGCVAVVSVRERSISPQMEDKNGVCSIVAIRDSIVTACTATNGNLLCRPGQAVCAGEVLISGYTDCGITIQATKAQGEVFGQTVRDISVISPSEYMAKRKTGENKRSFSLILGKKRINLWKDSGIWATTCDRIYEEYYVTLPGGFRLPMALTVEEYAVCETHPKSREVPEDRLSGFASERIRQQMVSGEIVTQDVTITQEDGYLCLKGKYICTEMIGKVQWEQIGEYNGENG